MPADWFIDATMSHLGRDYYVGFLTAAAAHGAAHQAPQFFQVVVDQHLADRDFGRVRLRFITSKRAGRVPTERRNSRVSSYAVAASEIVALDLAERPELGAGLSNVATVLRELPLTEGGLLARQAHHYPRAVARRLGWLLENVRDDLDLSELRRVAMPRAGELSPLDPKGPRGRGAADARWGVRVNTERSTVTGSGYGSDMDVDWGAISTDERQRRLTSEADRIADILADEGASLVVAFGSYARGETTGTSDLDVLAVLPTSEPFPARHLRLYEKIAPRVGLDLIVYTPEEFEATRERPFIREALEHGRVLHAA